MANEGKKNLTFFPRTGNKQIDAWLNLPWPEESVDDVYKFGKASALLYCYLNQEVQTPDGKGVLLQVLGKTCFVAFGKEEGKKFSYGRRYFTWQVAPDFAQISGANVLKKERGNQIA